MNAAAARLDTHDEADEPQNGGSPGYIAIVDDDEAFRRALERLLRACCFTVKAYPSGLEFLESLKASVPACLILDLTMPGMTGLEVLHHLAGARFKFPVIIATAKDEPGIRHRCELAGAVAFLEKPFTTEQLLSALVPALRGPVTQPSSQANKT